ncbi:unnamed protein product [Enterobius vermicularis]|uniref:PAP2_C domain-containing protein n=1 Tax=Enterobius vermicularis TaxID=51028 RepID=A0A0N4V9P1_ENTVE|nr:unnamed protein product [Enterobius vermicularis]
MSWEAWRGEVEKTVVAFCLMLVSAFLNFFLLTLIHDIVPRNSLPDIVFMLIPQQRWAWAVGDVFSTISSILGFACVLLHVNRLIVFRRLLLLGAIMYGLRAVVMSVTFLPPSFEHKSEVCLPQVNRTAMYTMEIASSWLAAPILIFGVAALVVSGGHYTMDVLIAYWLTSHIFYAYHQIFETPSSQRSDAPLSKLWWYYLCWWFEKDVPDGPLANEWDWPFSKPIILKDFVSKVNSRLR